MEICLQSEICIEKSDLFFINIILLEDIISEKSKSFKYTKEQQL